MEHIVLIIIYFIFSFVAGAVGIERTIGFWHALFISLLLSPIVGLILAFNSERYEVRELRDIQMEYFKSLIQKSNVSSSFENPEDRWQYPEY